MQNQDLIRLENQNICLRQQERNKALRKHHVLNSSSSHAIHASRPRYESKIEQELWRLRARQDHLLSSQFDMPAVLRHRRNSGRWVSLAKYLMYPHTNCSFLIQMTLDMTTIMSVLTTRQMSKLTFFSKKCSNQFLGKSERRKHNLVQKLQNLDELEKILPHLHLFVPLKII